jgi:hypothetical protein
MSSAIPLAGIPVFPSSAADNYEFKFVGEGNANVIFEIIEKSDGAYVNGIFRGKSRIACFPAPRFNVNMSYRQSSSCA